MWLQCGTPFLDRVYDAGRLRIFEDLEQKTKRGMSITNPTNYLFNGANKELSAELRSSYSKPMQPGDWGCPNCGDMQFARNTHCRQCGQERPGKKESTDDLEENNKLPDRETWMQTVVERVGWLNENIFAPKGRWILWCWLRPFGD